MPTPRSHGGAELTKAPLNLPAGFRGLNTQYSGAILGFEWATVLQNTVLDKGSRISARKGWVRVTEEGYEPGSARMIELFEYRTHVGDSELIACDEDLKVWSSKDGGLIWTDITGTASVTDMYIDFVNFNDKLYGFQQGGLPLVYDGVTLSNIVEPVPGDPKVPRGGVGMSAFGRLWASDAANTFLQYSAILDGTEWDYVGNNGAGGFDLRNVWEDTDTIQELREFNGALVVFGRNNILIWSDGQGSALGMDPLNMYVVDTIHGVGCFGRDAVVEVDGDLWFLSDSGVHSLSRIIEQRSNPLYNLSTNVHDDIMERARNVDSRDIKAVYSPEERFVMFSFPDAGNGDETGAAFIFDSRYTITDDEGNVAAPCVGVWNVLVPKCIVRPETSRDLLMFVGAASGNAVQRAAFGGNTLGRYDGFVDPRASDEDTLVPYQMQYESGWNDFGSPYMKIPKKFRGIFYTQGRTDLSFQIWYDFDSFVYNTPYALETDTDSDPHYWTNPADGTGDLPVTEDGFEWSDDPGGVGAQAAQAGEWSSAFKPVVATVPGVGGTGEYVRMGIQARIRGFPLSLQEISLYMKQGRLV